MHLVISEGDVLNVPKSLAKAAKLMKARSIPARLVLTDLSSQSTVYYHDVGGGYSVLWVLKSDNTSLAGI
jgi:hypothetical protein